MIEIPQIKVQLVHIQGPLKGEIQTFAETEIKIGRHPECEVQFPKDVVTISRQHAKIVRDGNRFKLIDTSTNGSYVNGQPVTEAYLKDGDVIMFAEGGPKLSFLTQTTQGRVSQDNLKAQPSGASDVKPPPPVKPAAQEPEPPQTPRQVVPQPSGAPTPAASPPARQTAIEPAKVPLAIQYGPALKSFQRLPITLGKGPGCDFPINHPALAEQHAQLFFAQGLYWIKDLTGSYSVSLNGASIQTQAPLEPDMTVSLSAQGPRFRFIAGGRLAEIEEQSPVKPTEAGVAPAPPEKEVESKTEKQGKAGSLFKKFFR